MFKEGETVYCIDNINMFGFKLGLLELDTPYIVNKDYNVKIILEGISTIYISNRFISKNDYNLSKRIEKINKIKECLK